MPRSKRKIYCEMNPNTSLHGKFCILTVIGINNEVKYAKTIFNFDLTFTSCQILLEKVLILEV